MSYSDLPQPWWRLDYIPGVTRGLEDFVMTPKERVERTNAWLEISGPLYADMEAKVITISPLGAKLVFTEDDCGELKYEWAWFSLASELMLREAKPGDILNLKVRCDDGSMNLP